MKVKICGITRVEDATAAVAAGADALGLMFVPSSPRRISLETARALARAIPPPVLRTGVFADPDPEEVFAAMRACGLNLLQFHGGETPEFCAQFGIMTMKAFRVRDASSLAEIPRYAADAVLLDSYVPGQAGGTGATFNWDLAAEAVKMGRPVFLAGGLHSGNVAAAIRQARPFGVDVSSGVESAPGIKDPEKMRAFIAAVRSA